MFWLEVTDSLIRFISKLWYKVVRPLDKNKDENEKEWEEERERDRDRENKELWYTEKEIRSMRGKEREIGSKRWKKERDMQ